MTEARTEQERKPPRGMCMAGHPLLTGVRCGRLAGHPGGHQAEASDGVGVVWTETEERTG